MTTTEGTAQDFAEDMEYTETGLVTQGLVARQVATHRVEPLPGRPMSTCRLEKMGGNSMFAMHLAQIPAGGYKCNHRHLDETLAYMVDGNGRTELRQSDYKAAIQTEWQAGDVVVIPTNSWHRHVNASDEVTARQLSFRSTPLMNRILHGGGGTYTIKDRVYNRGGRFTERFDDEDDYFTVREQLSPRRVRTNVVRQIADEELPAEDPSFGEGVAVKFFAMGGQLTLNVALVGVRAGGFVREHSPLAEESLLVLRGSGRSQLWNADGESHSVEWQAGDVICPPLGVRRRHDATDEVRLLKVRNVVIQRALDLEADEPGLDTPLPDRFDDMHADAS